MKIYVINLKKDVDRYKVVSGALEKLGLSWERVDAVQGSNVNREEHPEVFCGKEYIVRHNFLSKAILKGSLTNGELGCAMSHLRVYHKLALSGDEGAIILEDDFVPRENLSYFIEQALKAVPDADIIYCHGAIRAGLRSAFWLRPKKVPLTNKVVLRQGIPGFNWFFNRRRRRHMSTVCYWISRKAAMKLLDLGFPVKFESDVLTGMIAYNKLKFYVLYPGLGDLGGNPSSIQTHGGTKFY